MGYPFQANTKASSTPPCQSITCRRAKAPRLPFQHLCLWGKGPIRAIRLLTAAAHSVRKEASMNGVLRHPHPWTRCHYRISIPTTILGTPRTSYCAFLAWPMIVSSWTTYTPTNPSLPLVSARKATSSCPFVIATRPATVASPITTGRPSPIHCSP